ncbi:NIPSNAP-domain-containing protein [Tilletiopsis washingtonensis]|uniref:NIPSNAP-domain-containing protein n=1 Tax=Tilletiopsis washingtonensis TaxID=58919 RepID=A0A316ZHG5_9BASI|nr:NIPSNAP-domain-containing protein [Tilletiopsis washingtonensis]PWO00940.1 NIPSNAP-domain-containing protein [Tilletiopsis washingtonensis]
MAQPLMRLARPRLASALPAVRPAISASTPRAFSAAAPLRADDEPKAKQGLLKSLMHGSPHARAESPTVSQSHSKTVGRGKYIHEIQRLVVRPDAVDELRAVLAEFYPRLHKSDGGDGGRLVGSWEVVVGDQETFYTVWEYDGYAGYDEVQASLAKSETYAALQKKLRPLLSSRSNWLAQEFGFWATSPPNTNMGGVVEWRTYHLKPGMLLEWETNWRRGLEARRKYVQPVAAYFTQIGGLHTVHHLWHYPNLDERKKTRDAAWQVETWNDTVSQTVKLIDKMHAQIMKPLPFSPLR